jgi:hypothetical protein
LSSSGVAAAASTLVWDSTSSRVGIGTATPINTLDVYGSQITRNITTYNTDPAGWYQIGLWDASVGTGGSNGQRLRLELFGGEGYNLNSTEQWGGVTTIYATIMNDPVGSSATAANCGGFWKHEGSASPCVSAVKFVQFGTDRNKYYVRVYLYTYTHHGLRVETTQGSAFTPTFTASTDPGVNSSTVRAAVLSYITAGQYITRWRLNIASFDSSGSDMASTDFNYILRGANDAGQKLVIFVNGSARTADGGVNNVTIRNDNGNLILGNVNYPTIIPGNLGIGVTTTAYKLDVNGTIGAAGDITALYSDERLKTKTGELSEALTKVCSLDTFTYVNNDLAKSLGFTDELQRVGVSAQQVQKVLPEAVRPAPFDADNKSGQNYLTVQYEKLVPLLIEALKEERQKREALEERLERMEKLLLKE